MLFIWNEAKRLTNLTKHGIDFEDALSIWLDRVVEIEDPRNIGGERRIVAIGAVSGRIIAVVYTWRGDVRRIISARAARTYEREAYHAAIAERPPDG